MQEEEYISAPGAACLPCDLTMGNLLYLEGGTEFPLLLCHLGPVIPECVTKSDWKGKGSVCDYPLSQRARKHFQSMEAKVNFAGSLMERVAMGVELKAPSG